MSYELEKDIGVINYYVIRIRVRYWRNQLLCHTNESKILT